MKLVLFILIIFVPLLVRAEDDTKAFYAVSSLYFHVEMQSSPNDNPESKKNEIVFTQSDVAALWATAENSSYSQQVELARMYYYEALEKNDAEARPLLSMAKDILDGIWKKRNPTLYGGYASQADNINDYLAPPELKSRLDNCISNSQVVNSPISFRKAGFFIFHERPSTLIIAKHPFLHGYLEKVYLMSSGKSLEQVRENLINRCKGALNVRHLIKEKNLRYFTVPDKWIYLSPHLGGWPILVVTEMPIAGHAETKKAWKDQITHGHLRELYCILSHGYSSTQLPHNIPFVQNGKFSCIDTEHPQRHLRYDNVKSYISDEMSSFWDKLVRTGGNF